MEQRIEKMVKSGKQPSSENVAWVDTASGKAKLKIYNNGTWQTAGGGASGSSNPGVEIGTEEGINEVKILTEDSTTAVVDGNTLSPTFEVKSEQKPNGSVVGGFTLSYKDATGEMSDSFALSLLADCDNTDMGTNGLVGLMALSSNEKTGVSAAMQILANQCLITTPFLQITQDSMILGNSTNNADINLYIQNTQIGGESNNVSIAGRDLTQLSTNKTVIKAGVNIGEDTTITHNMVKLSSNNNGKKDTTSRYIQFNDDSIVFYNNGKTATLTLS